MRYLLGSFERRPGGSAFYSGVLRLSRMNNGRTNDLIGLDGVPPEISEFLGVTEMSEEVIGLVLRQGSAWEVSAAVGLLIAKAFSRQGGRF